MSNLENEASISTEQTLMKVAEAVLSGATLKIIVPLHDDRNIVPDSLLQEPHVTEIVETLQGSKPDLKEYVNRHLFPIANHYRIAANYLQEKYKFNPDSDTYEDWRVRLANQMDQYLQSEYCYFKDVDDERWRLGDPETDSELEDKDILAAVAVIDSADQIAKRLVVSDSVVPCNLDAIIQLAELHSFCDASFKFWESEKTKKDGHREIRSRNLRNAQEAVRQEIRNKLERLLNSEERSKYFHSGGERSGQPYFECIIKALKQEFKSDDEWKRKALERGKKPKTPSKDLMRQEISKFCANR